MHNPLAVTIFICALFLSSVFGASAEEVNALPQGGKDIIPEFAPYLAESGLLPDGGGTIVVDANGWLALGVGIHILPKEKKDQSKEYAAWKIADHYALTGIIEALEGITYSGKDMITTDSSGDPGQSSNTTVSIMREEITGIVSGSREVGRWIGTDGSTYHVVRVVFSPGHPLRKVKFGFAARDVDLTPPWNEEFLSRSHLQNGGADVVVVSGKAYILVVGVATIKDNTSTAKISALRVADIKARAQLLSFYNGISLKHSQEVSTMMRESPYELPHDQIIEQLSSRTESQIKGIAGRMTCVGSWLSADYKQISRAYVIDVEDL